MLNSVDTLLAIWLIITIISVIAEIATVQLISIWFSVGGVAAIIANLLNASDSIQITLFIVISLICLAISRPIAKKYLRANVVNTNSDRVINKHGLVTKTISADSNGEVKVMSTSWMATSIDNTTIQEGEYCEVLAIEGAHLVVKKIER